MSRVDLGALTYDEFVITVFEHEASDQIAAEPWYSTEEIEVNVPVQLIRNCTRLWQDFSPAMSRFTPSQVNQGLWLLLGGCVWLGRYLADRGIPLEERITCIESMFSVFSDYIAGSKLEVMPNVFHMWWKLVITAMPVVDDGPFDPRKDHLQTREAVLRTLKRILALPDGRAQMYALHGLAYLPHPEVSAVVQQWLAANRNRLSSEEADWVERVRDGEFRRSAG
jgi:hypothetical protein